MASSADPKKTERFPNNAKYFVLNNKVVECLQKILEKTYNKLTTENHRFNEQHEIINFNLLALLAIDSRSRIDSTNTRLPNSISKRIASYLTGYGITKANFKSVDLNCDNLYIDLKNYETMYLLLILLYYSNNEKYITKNPKCIIIDKVTKKREYNFYMQIFYILFIEVFSLFFKNNSNIYDPDLINLFVEKFLQFANYEIIKEIFDAVIEVNVSNLNPNKHIERLNLIEKIRSRIVAKKPNSKSNPFITIKKNLATEFSQLDPAEQLRLLQSANNSILSQSQKHPQEPKNRSRSVRRRLNLNFGNNSPQKPIQTILSQSPFPGPLETSSYIPQQTFSFNSSQNYTLPMQQQVSRNSTLAGPSTWLQYSNYHNLQHNPFPNNDNEALRKLFETK